MAPHQILDMVKSDDEEKRVRIAMASLCEALRCRFWVISVLSPESGEDRPVEIGNLSEISDRERLSTSCLLSPSTLKKISADGGPFHWHDVKAAPSAGILAETADVRGRLGIRDGVSLGLGSDVAHFYVLSLVSQRRIEPWSHDTIVACVPFLRRSLQSMANSRLADRLTERERQVLQWAAFGKTSWEISQILHVSERTINFHMSRSIEKLGATNRAHAVARAVQINAVSLDQDASHHQRS